MGLRPHIPACLHKGIMKTSWAPTCPTPHPGLGGGNIIVRMWEMASFRGRDKQMNVYLETMAGLGGLPGNGGIGLRPGGRAKEEGWLRVDRRWRLWEV